MRKFKWIVRGVAAAAAGVAAVTTGNVQAVAAAIATGLHMWTVRFFGEQPIDDDLTPVERPR